MAGNSYQEATKVGVGVFKLAGYNSINESFLWSNVRRTLFYDKQKCSTYFLYKYVSIMMRVFKFCSRDVVRRFYKPTM